MKARIVLIIVVAIFSAATFAETAWTKNSGKAKDQKNHEYHHNFIWSKIYLRLLKLEKSVHRLNQELDEETKQRQSADQRLKFLIDDEAEIREKNDIALEEEIDREAGQREMSDEQLEKRLDEETAARKEADEDLQEQIDSIETGAARVPIFFSSGADEIDPTQFKWMGLGHLSIISSYGMVTPMAGEIKNLYGYSALTLDGTDSIFFALYVNRIKTDLECKIIGADICTNNEISVPVNAGDRLTVFVLANGLSAETQVGASVMLGN